MCRKIINFLAYRQESISRSRWITTANGYLRLLLFYYDKLNRHQQTTLKRLVSYIVSVYVPSFIMMHLKPQAAEGPQLTLFRRDLLNSYQEIDKEIADVVFKYFLDHAVHWLSPKNVSLSVFSEVPPYCMEAVKTASFPDVVNTIGVARIFDWGGAQILKNSAVFTEIESDFSAKIRNSNDISAQNQVISKKKKKKKVFTEIKSDFSAEIGNSNDFSAQNQVISKKKKKKRSSPKLRVIFQPKSEIRTIFPPKIR